jgi:hypothetical protein
MQEVCCLCDAQESDDLLVICPKCSRSMHLHCGDPSAPAGFSSRYMCTDCQKLANPPPVLDVRVCCHQVCVVNADYVDSFL